MGVSLLDLVEEVAVEQEGLHLERFKLLELADPEISPLLASDGPDVRLSQVALVEVVRLLDQILLLDEGSDRKFLDLLVLKLRVFKPLDRRGVGRGVQHDLFLLYSHHVAVDLHGGLQLLVLGRLLQLGRFGF